ncbi:bifunctional diguanylate cyclase/phosphodiesterase [Rhodococcus sp. 14-2470-1a]|uniref:putative bifunctional diguanylate cyclase/phosphodiesterase n=1 Tax=Rhodococcus sp. 14-2470-1a TaxID=2023150 RepID=UPI000B9B87E8|nr:bifunctional diguanylate cyclase/phosphodiesterase [Rhodococcus sp. 14-2470-1a]OZF49776.1 GGDEF-domain containing protein [Rhodococcus sp. 14-2470-1a]
MNRETPMPRPAVENPFAVPQAELDLLSDPLVLVDRDFVVTYANPAAAALLTAPIDTLVGRCIDAWFTDPAWTAFVSSCNGPGVYEDFSYTLQKWLSYRTVKGSSGHAIWATDITSERLGDTRVEWTDDLARTMLDAVPSGVVVLDVDGVVVLVNSVWSTFWADRPQTDGCLPGTNYFDLWAPAIARGNDTAISLVDGLRALISGSGQVFSSNHRFGSVVYRVRATRLADGGIYLTHTDITAQAAEAPVRQDPLTGLPNRDEIEALLATELAVRTDENEVSILLVDIDGFREFNDALGPVHGDELLQQVAERIAASTRPNDTLGRLTGDEFVVIARGCQAIAARALAAGFSSVLEPSFTVDDRQLTVTASVGVATSGPDSDDPVQLIHDATTAMHAAKNLGRSSHQVFSADLRDSNRTRLELVERLRGVAMAEHELQMVYQPIVELASGAVIGAEALIRWNHPELGLLMPDSFIGLAEDADLIIPLSNWILSQVCRTLAAWQCKDLNIQVGVNVSPLHFAAGTLATDVNSIIDSLGIEPGRLVLELAESKSLHDIDAVHYQLMDVRRHGSLIAIDDFGSGFSSLERLATLPVDILKIDKSLTQHLDSRDLQRRRAMTSLCKAVVDVTHDLGRDTVVEGIETKDQLASCVDMGVTFGQGHLLGKPMTAPQLETILLPNDAHSASA